METLEQLKKEIRAMYDELTPEEQLRAYVMLLVLKYKRELKRLPQQ